MFPSSADPEVASMQQNIPSMMLEYTAYTPVFGSYFASITAPQPGQLMDQFPTMGYTSLEGLLYAAQGSNPMVQPANIVTGATFGSQSNQGTQIQQDGIGVPRSLSGYQSSNTP